MGSFRSPTSPSASRFAAFVGDVSLGAAATPDTRGGYTLREMRRADVLFLLAGSVTACGARTPLEVPSSIADGGAPDASAACVETSPAPPCTSWQVAGADQLVSASSGIGDAIGLGDVVSAGCGALVAWYTLSAPNAETLSWSTRSVGFDGAPRAPIEAHPSLTLHTTSSGAISLATNGARAAGLEEDSSGCHFLALDADGADVGAMAPQATSACSALAAESDGFSYLSPSAQGETPVALARIDAQGVLRATTPLMVPPNRALWDRYVFDDGTFLLDTFAEDANGVYTDWLQRFDARGNPLAPESVVGANTAPVWVAATAMGALAGWEWSTVSLVPVTRDGAPSGPVQTEPATGALYGMTLASVPNGDAMLLSLVLDGASEFDLYAQAVAPDGSARGTATLIRTSQEQSRIYAIVAPAGDRALLVFEDGGVRTLPLTCVP